MFIALLSVATSLAQVGTATLTGNVRDSSGGAIPNASVNITNEESGAPVVLKTNADGIYRASTLLPGSYRVEIRATGFESQARSGITVSVAQTVAVDLVLQVGQQTQAVEVSSAVVTLQTQESSIGQLVDRKSIENLPVGNRSATSLVALSPGVVMINSGEGAENYPVFSVAGGRARNQDFTLDGGNVTNAVGVTRPQQQTSLPLDAMQEFRVISNNYSAEYGHSTGGIIALSTRSGTNAFHGSLFEFARNNALDARNFFSAKNAPLNLHQYGGSLGGPIRKDKTHFFVSWEETRETYGSANVQTVPTLLQRQGDFSRTKTLLYDPLTLTSGKKLPYAGNMIPGSAQDAVAIASLNYIPTPNQAPTSGTSGNFGANSHSDLRRDILVAKLDHTLSAHDQLTARYYINDYLLAEDGSYRIPAADPAANNTDGRVQSIMLSEVHTFRPDLLNNLSISYDRRHYVQTRVGAGQGLARKIGLGNVSDAAFPTLNINGYALLGAQGTTNAAAARLQTPITDTQVMDALSFFRGKHALKAGIEFRKGYNRETDDITSAGSFVFTRQITGQPGVSGTGDAFASFLIGQANQASLQKLDTIPSHASYWAAYLQDDYWLTTRLTLNYGLRWEVELPRYVDGNRMNSFDPKALNPVSGTPGIVTFAGRNGVPTTAFDPNYKNFGPRFGFAYHAASRRDLVIRGGAGIFYGPMASTSIGPAAPLGFSDNISLVSSAADTAAALVLRNGFPSYTRQSPDAAGFGAVSPGGKPNTAVTYFERNRPTPVSYQFNFDIQNEVVKDLILETGYIGNVSHRLTSNDLSINQVPPQSMGPGTSQPFRPFPQFSNVSLINPPVGNSTYHAVFLKAERRFGKSLSIMAHFTFSKFLDDAAASTEFGDPGSYMDAYNRRLDKGRSGSDIPRRAVITFLYTLPKLAGTKWLNGAIGGWAVSSLAVLQSGQTFTVYDSVNNSNANIAGTMRPNLIADPLTGTQTPARWFNTAAFQTAPAYKFGNSPRSVLRDAAWKTVDFNLAKSFKVTERISTEVRGEFFNSLNHANFDIPGHTLGNADFGVTSAAEPARTVQVALRLIF